MGSRDSENSSVYVCVHMCKCVCVCVCLCLCLCLCVYWTSYNVCILMQKMLSNLHPLMLEKEFPSHLHRNEKLLKLYLLQTRMLLQRGGPVVYEFYKLYTYTVMCMCNCGRLQRPRGMIFHHATLTCSRSTFQNVLGQSLDQLAKYDEEGHLDNCNLVRILPKAWCTLHVYSVNQ